MNQQNATGATLDVAVLERLFDEFDAGDFRSAERIVAAFKRQGVSRAQYPKVRPEDCRRATVALAEILERHLRFFKLGDRVIIDRFWRLADDFAEGDIRSYPTEVHHLSVVRAEARIAEGDPDGAVTELGTLADRIYLIEGDASLLRRVVNLQCRAKAMSGDVIGATSNLVNIVIYLIRLTPRNRHKVFEEFTELLALGPRRRFSHAYFEAWANRAARVAADAGRPRGRRMASRIMAVVRKIAITVGYLSLRMQMVVGEIRLRKMPGDTVVRSPETLVTRAMGGIGDLMMMTAGLRLLSVAQGRPVKLATRKGFFALFENNPYVELIDINGPAIDPFSFRRWRNLSFCPAGRFETARRPNVRRNRIELFARGMGVKWFRRVWKSHTELDLKITTSQMAEAKAFLKERGLGETRPLIGVQPFSRDSYKDHPEIGEIIADLAQDYDVLIFHHAATSFETLDGVDSTAGQPLSLSIALVGECSSMVCVDSAFLHVAAAHQIPIVCMFGPTDGALFTRDYKNVEVVAEWESFVCMPCWRNEDLPCQITQQIGISPCVAAIRSSKVRAALQRVRQGAGLPT